MMMSVSKFWVRDKGLRLKLKKFMQPEVAYLGFKISKDGIFSLQEKIKVITNAEEPQSASGIFQNQSVSLFTEKRFEM